MLTQSGMSSDLSILGRWRLVFFVARGAADTTRESDAATSEPILSTPGSLFRLAQNRDARAISRALPDMAHARRKFEPLVVDSAAFAGHFNID